MCSTSFFHGGVAMRRVNLYSREGRREHFVIMHNINQSRYIIKGLRYILNVNVTLHFCPINPSCLPSTAPFSRSLFTTEYRPELLRMWMFLYAFLHVRFPLLFTLSHSLTSSCFGEHPFLASHHHLAHISASSDEDCAVGDSKREK